MNENKLSIFDTTKMIYEAQQEKTKNYSDTFLYNKGEYEKGIFNFMMACSYVDKASSLVQNMKSDIRARQNTTLALKVLESDKTVLCYSKNPLPKAFKVFVGKDIKGDKSTLKLFIDISTILNDNNGTLSYIPGDIDILISYLLNGMNAMIYYADPHRITSRSRLTELGAICFSSLIFYIIDSLRIASISNARAKCLYMAAKYYLICILGRENSEATNHIASKVSGLSENEAGSLYLFLEDVDPYVNISTFCTGISKVLRTPEFNLGILVEQWIFRFGTGTQFATELYPAFAGMIIHAYMGAYLNNQRTIEKCLQRNLKDFAEEIFKVGSEVL